MARLRRRRAKPFLVNIGGGVLIPLMGRAATGTGPQPITQGDGMVDKATDMAAFGGREAAALSCGPSAHAVAGNAAPLSWGRSAVADAGNKAVDVMDMRPMLLGGLMQNLYKPAKA